ncbi:unnamed protein product, partial [Pleuronectes platessa]
MQRIIISTDMNEEQECTSSSTLQDPSPTLLVWNREMRTLEALQELDVISLTLIEMMEESFTPTENLMDKNPRQRELLKEYSALKDPEAQDIFLLKELIAQFTAMKELVDENPHLDSSALGELKAAIPQLKEKMDENPHLRTQVDENIALMELDSEHSTLKEQTATNNLSRETEGKMVEHMESPASPGTLEALQELDDISLTLVELMEESFTPTELMDKNPRQRELLNEYSALKDPEAEYFFLLKELIAQVTAMKELVDEHPHLDSSALRELKAAIPQLKEQMDENFALMELDGEHSTLKEQTATSSLTWETEGKMVEQMESPASPGTLEALEELDVISLTRNELIEESFTPTELMDENPRQRELQ